MTIDGWLNETAQISRMMDMKTLYQFERSEREEDLGLYFYFAIACAFGMRDAERGYGWRVGWLGNNV